MLILRIKTNIVAKQAHCFYFATSTANSSATGSARMYPFSLVHFLLCFARPRLVS